MKRKTAYLIINPRSGKEAGTLTAMLAVLVTPAPTNEHETILARLTRILDPYVEANGLGYVYRPRAVVRFDGCEVEPDLMVRQPLVRDDATWDDAPIPVLVVEVFSGNAARSRQWGRTPRTWSAAII